MDMKKLIMEMFERKEEVKASDIVKTTDFSRAYINRFFQDLRVEGKVVLIGKANRARYVLANKEAVKKAAKKIGDITLTLQNKGLLEDKILNDIKKKTGIFFGIRKNISDILGYAFSEMLNNAIEHSDSKTIKVTMKKEKDNISFKVIDKGVGIFNNIMRKKKLQNTMEAIQDLLKGKQTTAPAMHSGEGIFFTSKVADVLLIQGSRKKIVFNNILDDIFINDIKKITGTKIAFSVDLNSKKNLNEIFRQYTDSSFEFSKTTVTIRLYKMESKYISRSQARRIVSGLEKFKTITLDFKDVKLLGQGFADEIFRVWKSNHPNISIRAINADENVEFMINRAKPK
jgi:anti-sigma regulatory factor (Ser/Thr protein kinase)